MQKHSQRRALLDSIVIDHGPQDLLSRVFLQGDNAARRRGLTLSFENLERVAEIVPQAVV